MILAREWQEAMDGGEYASQAELARKKGISRARVTERELRAIVRVPKREHLRKLKALCE